MVEPEASPHRLVEFMTAVGRCPSVQAAHLVAAELVAEEFDAEVGAVVVDGRLEGHVGFGRDVPPEAHLLDVPPGSDRCDLPGLGSLHTLSATWRRGSGGRLVVARAELPFELGDRTLLLGMAGALGLTLDMIAALERERGRQHLLEVLLGVQRAISARQPVPDILSAITAGASSVLGDRPVALLLQDAADPGRPIVTGAGEVSDGPCHRAVVEVDGAVVGEIVAGTADGRTTTAEQSLLDTFAGHASMALTDARAMDALAAAFRDPLTGLPNRSLFLDRLGEALRGDRGRRNPAVLFVDLDRFKAVNDTLGHAGGDELLRAVARRLTDCTRAGDTVARFGGDEFALLLADGDDPHQVRAVADRLVASLREPFTLGQELTWIGATVGIAHAPPDRDDVDTDVLADRLLGDADLAMYTAKAAGGGRSATYRPQMRSARRDHLALRAHLPHALARGELDVHYQPVVELGTGRPLAVEALVRWWHPERGAVPPVVFVPVAESTGLIVEIGRWVLQRACRQAALWRRDQPNLLLHVNVSVHQLRDPAFVPDVVAALDVAGLPGEALVLEITESLVVGDDAALLQVLADLRALGVSLALDDFGTGFSSLGYLSRLSVDLLKIDRSFVTGLAEPGGRQLVQAVMDLARAFALRVVVEGVETPDQVAQLLAVGCTTAQGYHFARPGPVDVVTAFLRDHAPAPRRTPAAGAAGRVSAAPVPGGPGHAPTTGRPRAVAR
ncbi:putative bifunctional diguanylate cyclase/phosphodiesterase [Jannaschia sp. R86511]|uniref:putative bifunctional diguanylate cyclase/phosphodiesterase n=1 Tax=Jannaschia sp. R86511 TaxID=3093853 RepID=UPI0036D27F09